MSKNYYIIPIFVPHEGCPHNCVFCNQNSITGSNIAVTGNTVKEIVDAYLKTITAKDTAKITIEISFFGGTFTAIPIEKQKELLQIAKEYKEQNKVNYIRLSTRPDYISSEILQHLKDYSVDIIELGIQSFDNTVLSKSGRGHTKLDAIKASNLIKQYGFILGHQLMIGLPGDTFEIDIRSAIESVHLKPNLCRIYPALVIKNTPMEKMYLEGAYTPYSLEQAIEATKKVYAIMAANDIHVIRMGLQPTEIINEGGDIVAGPFHPAFRELVEGSLYNDMIVNALPSGINDIVTLRINSINLSKLYCDKKKFFNDIKSQLKPITLQVIVDNTIDNGDILLNWDIHCKKLSIKEYLLIKATEGNSENL